jgi:hypothetical protein
MGPGLRRDDIESLAATVRLSEDDDRKRPYASRTTVFR